MSDVSGGGAFIDSNGHDITIGTVLNGVGALVKNGAGTLKLTQSNNYSGGTSVNQGTLLLATDWAMNNVSIGGVTVGAGAILRADNSLANQLNGLTLNGGTVDAVNSAGNLDWGNFHLTGNVTATGTSSLNADVALRASNVDFSVASGGTLNVGGVLHNGHLFGRNSGFPATISKNGPGTMVLSGGNTYSGATSVLDGALLINGVQTGGGLITVSSTATLGGGGQVGDVDMWTAGTLAPGDATRTDNWLQVAALNLGDPATLLEFELGAPDDGGTPLAANDLVLAASLPYLRGIVNVTPQAGFAAAPAGSKWRLFDLTAGTVPAGNELTLAPALAGGYSLQAAEGDTAVYLVAVPEAATAGLAMLGAFLLRALRRRA